MLRLICVTFTLAVFSVPAFSQVPQPPKGVIQFKPFNGVNPEQFQQSSIGRWVGQVTLETNEVKTSVATSRLGFGQKAVVARKADAVIAAADVLARLAKQGASRNQLAQGFAQLDQSVNDLTTVINSNALSQQVAGEALGKVQFATQQLGGQFGNGGGGDPNQRLKAAILLSDSLDDQTESLRDLGMARLGPAYPAELDQSIRAYARAARQLGRTIRDTGDLERARKDFEGFQTVGWQNVTARLAAIPNLPADIRAQVIRVDGVARQLSRVLGGAEPGPGPGPNPRVNSVIAVAAGDGGGPRVRVFHNLQNKPVADFFAYDPKFQGGVRIAVADLNGDGVPDIVTAPGPGMRALIRVFDGRDANLLVEFFALDPTWQGGVQIAAADLTKTGQALIAVAPDVGGGPQVQVFDLAQGKEIDSFFAFPNNLRGGVRLAWGDINGDGLPDLACTPGPCEHGPEVKIFDGKNRKVLAQFMALDPRWRGGLFVAVEPLTNNVQGRIIIGADAGGTPLVRVFDLGRNKLDSEWLAFPDAFRGGVRVASHDVDGDGRAEVICTPGPGFKDCPMRVFNVQNRKSIADVPTFSGFEGGAFVGAH